MSTICRGCDVCPGIFRNIRSYLIGFNWLSRALAGMNQKGQILTRQDTPGHGKPDTTKKKSATVGAGKKTSGHGVGNGEADPSPDSQSMASRRSAEVETRGLIAKFASAHARKIATIRRLLLKRLPTAHEIVYEYQDCVVISYSADDRGYEGVVAIRASGEGIRLYFNRGKELADPSRVLEGSGKQTRFLNIVGPSTLVQPEIAKLVEEAIAISRVAFASSGRGSVVIRSTVAKKRRESGSKKSPQQEGRVSTAKSRTKQQ